MSVRSPERNTSEAQFLTTARELERETRRRCVNGPKRYTFYGLQELWQTSRWIHREVGRANFFPTTKDEADERRKHFKEALSWAQDYNTQLSLLLDDQIFTPTGARCMSNLLRDEIKLIKAVMKSDKSRFANLP